MHNYKSVRFIGWAIGTGGLTVEKDDELVGRYGGDDDADEDIKYRLDVMEKAVDAAARKAAELTKKESGNEAEILKIFVSPEFFFRGERGAYQLDDYDKVIAGLRKLANHEKYQHWVFCFGSILGVVDLGLDVLLSDLKQRWAAEKKRNDKLEVLPLGAFESPEAYAREYYGLSKKGVKIPSGLWFSKDSKVTMECYNVVLVQRGNAGMREDDDTGSKAVRKDWKSTVDFLAKGFDDHPPPAGVVSNERVSHPERTRGPEDEKRLREKGVPGPRDAEGAKLKDTKSKFKNSDGTAFAHFKSDKTNLKDIVLGVEICKDHIEQRLVHSGKKCRIQLVTSCGMFLQKDSLALEAGGYAFICDGDNKTSHTELWKIDEGGKLDKMEAVGKKMETIEGPAVKGIYFFKGPGKIHLYPAQDFPRLHS